MDANGLIWARQPGKALTWMDAVVRGVPVTPRAGYAVEINALLVQCGLLHAEIS